MYIRKRNKLIEHESKSKIINEIPQLKIVTKNNLKKFKIRTNEIIFNKLLQHLY